LIGGIALRILNSALDGGEWTASGPSRFTRGKSCIGTQCIGGGVSTRVSMESVTKIKKIPLLFLPGIEHRSSST